MSNKIKNLPESVHNRLKGLARQAQRPFQEYFYYYAIERFLYRLTQSPYAERFVLKGGLMFLGWGIPLRRPTRDIDVQAYLSSSVVDVVEIVQAICSQEVEADGMRFDPTSVRGEQIIEVADYAGVRAYFTGYMGQADIHLHMDVSFANVITPGFILVEYPTLLGSPAFTIRGYPIETTIAEKFQAMVVLDNINDRMKDFYDIWLLSQQVNIPGSILLKAIHATFEARRTSLPDHLPTALSDEFALSRQSDWARFLKRSLIDDPYLTDFSTIVEILRRLFWPILQAASNGTSWSKEWKAGGPWQA
jgi:predicted nucleotidyltransferase component of viral defense system